ncbi:MAG: 2-dehydropantoate 2-reductase [Clostridia bacterium]|nr:2-dehydropantoate 2-reductase [Clostridia bacterium]
MKIAIYGAGAMGTVLGSYLTKGGADVTLISRNREHIEGLKQNGAKILCVADGTEENIPVRALLPEEMTERYDIIFLMTKQRENEKTLQFLKDYLLDDGIVCTTQNGLPEESVVKALGTERAYGAAVSFGATFVGGGCVKLTSQKSAMSVLVGGYQNDNAKTPLLAEALQKAGEAIGTENFVTATDNLAGARWSKLAINAAFSTLSTITGLTFGEVAKRSKTKKLALKILREAFAVAKAQGVTLEKMQGHDLTKLFGGKGFFKTMIAYCLLPVAMKRHKMLVSGMLKDIEAGKKCDVDFVAGAVVAAGKRENIPTPYTEKAVQIVHGIENGLYEISYANADFFEI